MTTIMTTRVDNPRSCTPVRLAWREKATELERKRVRGYGDRGTAWYKYLVQRAAEIMKGMGLRARSTVDPREVASYAWVEGVPPNKLKALVMRMVSTRTENRVEAQVQPEPPVGGCSSGPPYILLCMEVWQTARIVLKPTAWNVIVQRLNGVPYQKIGAYYGKTGVWARGVERRALERLREVFDAQDQ